MTIIKRRVSSIRRCALEYRFLLSWGIIRLGRLGLSLDGMPSLVALLPAFCEKTAFSTLEVATRTGLNLSPSQQGRPFSLSAESYVSLLHLIHPENVVKNIRRWLIFKGSFFKSISFFQAYRVATVFEAIALLSVRYS